jgi:hypothetical protein
MRKVIEKARNKEQASWVDGFNEHQVFQVLEKNKNQGVR